MTARDEAEIERIMEPSGDNSTTELNGLVVLITTDETFANRVRLLLVRDRSRYVVAVFRDSLPALAYLLENRPSVIVLDADNMPETEHRNVLKAIRLACRQSPIILCASHHSAVPLNGDDVVIFYRILKSDPDVELESAIDSGLRVLHRSATRKV